MWGYMICELLSYNQSLHYFSILFLLVYHHKVHAIRLDQQATHKHTWSHNYYHPHGTIRFACCF
jgi:hypothetical protein